MKVCVETGVVDLIKEYIFDFKETLDLYLAKMTNLFDLSDRELAIYVKKIQGEMEANNRGYTKEDVIKNAYYYGYLKSELHRKMRCRTRAMFLACITQVWEQQLFELVSQPCFLKENDEKRVPFIYTGGNKFCEVCKYYKEIGIYLQDMEVWSEIEALRDVVNTVKHGRGSSLKNLNERKAKKVSVSSYENIDEKTIREFCLQQDAELIVGSVTKTSLLNEFMNIDDSYITKAVSSFIVFWENFICLIENINGVSCGEVDT